MISLVKKAYHKVANKIFLLIAPKLTAEEIIHTMGPGVYGIFQNMQDRGDIMRLKSIVLTKGINGRAVIMEAYTDRGMASRVLFRTNDFPNNVMMPLTSRVIDVIRTLDTTLHMMEP